MREAVRFLTLVGEHELLLFWVALVVLLGTARLLGSLMQRVGQPRVVGELGAGVLIGPTVFGRLFPDLAGWLFPGGEVESALLMAVAWLGIVLLLLVTGFETDLGLLRRLGLPAVSLSTGSLVLPLGLGISLGWIMPQELWGAPISGLVVGGVLTHHDHVGEGDPRSLEGSTDASRSLPHRPLAVPALLARRFGEQRRTRRVGTSQLGPARDP